LRNQLPAMILRTAVSEMIRRGMSPDEAERTQQTLMALEERGVPVLDKEIGLPLEDPENRIEKARRMFGELPAGVTHFICHPSLDTPELRAITRDWRGRVADYELFMREEVRDMLKELGIHAIGYRTLRDLIRSGK